MNLVNDPWIPVIGTDNVHRLASLTDIFKDGDSIADLAANPCQRIALLRLLICIAQAALDGPADEADWQACRPRISPAALAYLQKWQHRFNLFGDHAFLQVDGLVAPDDSFIKPPNTMDATSANGGTGLAMLWDHKADAVNYSPSDVSLPLSLLCYVNFSCSGKVGKSQWLDTLFNGSTAAGPSHNYLHTYVLGNGILDSIHFNLIPKTVVASSVTVGDSNWGAPVWEQMPKSSNDIEAIANAAETYLGRLVPLSRLVKLIGNENHVCCEIGPPPDALRMKRLPFLREPSATVILVGKEKQPAYLLARAGRHIWRDLEAILMSAKECGTLALQPFLQTYVYTRRIDLFRIWTGGSVRGDNEAKYDDLTEWCADLSSACFTDRTLTAYRSGIETAESGEVKLLNAMKKYSKPDKDKPGRDTKQIPSAWAKGLYWNSLDCEFLELLKAVEENTTAAFSKWNAAIKHAMRTAYSQTCPHETPRQIQAYTQGLKILEAWKGGE